MTRSRPKPSAEDGVLALRDHVLDRAGLAREKYGPHVGVAALERILADRSVVRYPCRIVFDTADLRPGEMAFVRPRGEVATDGFDVVVHPRFAADEDSLPAIVLYQLVMVNYGEIATENEAELFGATILGIAQDAYYERLCQIADSLAGQADGGR
ncbi:MAG: hypothetical protein ACYSVY_10345 [Planctomycetota bacterium]|jgi:hypothetical protein